MKRVLGYLFMAMTVAALAAAGAAYAAKPAEGGSKEGAEPSEPRQKENTPATGRHAYPADYKPQIVYGKDLVGVTPHGTLLCRYRGDWNDFWGTYFESYLAEAKANAAARGTAAKKVRFAAPILKNCEVVAGDGTLGGDGKPLRGLFSLGEAQQAELRRQGALLADFFYAASDGQVTVEVLYPVIEGLKVTTGPQNRTFLIWAKGLQDQLLPRLKEYEDAGIIMWIFVTAGGVEVQNPAADAKGKPLGFGRGPYGLSFPAWPLYGGYTQTTTAAAAGLWVHEFNHRFLDGLRHHLGVQLTKNHGQGLLGYTPEKHNLDERYFAVYRHLIRPAMWDRFTVHTPDIRPLEPFSGKAYAWADVQDDCWFKTPELHNAELAKLTGIDSFEIVRFAGSQRLFTVAEADRAKVLSTYIEPPMPWRGKRGETPPPDAPPPPPVQLDNYIATTQESCAVVKTTTGTWLFVSANMADLYADMLKISGKGDKQIPVYGYVNLDILPLLVFKAPADMPLPACEEGFFRTPVAGGEAAK